MESFPQEYLGPVHNRILRLDVQQDERAGNGDHGILDRLLPKKKMTIDGIASTGIYDSETGQHLGPARVIEVGCTVQDERAEMATKEF